MKTDEEVKTELDDRIKETIRIYCAAKECYNYCTHLYVPITFEEADLAKQNFHINMLQTVLFRQAVIELFKLISDSKNDYFRIFATIASLRPSGEYASLNFPDYTIAWWDRQLGTKEELIRRIRIFRKKFFAHTDNERDKFSELEVQFFGVFELFEIIKEILTDIHRIVFDSDLDLTIPSDNYKIDIIEQLTYVVEFRKTEKYRLNKIIEEKIKSGITNIPQNLILPQ